MKKTIQIKGMNCGHCVKAIEKALSKLEGITAMKISLEDKSAVVDFNNHISDEALKDAIINAGYEVVTIK